MTVVGQSCFPSGADYMVQLNPTTSTFANVSRHRCAQRQCARRLFGRLLMPRSRQYTDPAVGRTQRHDFAALATVNLPNNYTAA